MKLVSNLIRLGLGLSLAGAPVVAAERGSYPGVIADGHGGVQRIFVPKKDARAERIRKGKLYRAYLDFLTAYEQRHPEELASRGILEFLLNDAYAAGESCMLAGFIGVKSGGRCKPAEGSSFNALRAECRKQGADVPCNPEIFGEGLCITPKDSRWTKACEQAAVEAAGGNEAEKLGKYVETKKISLAKMKERMKELCAAAQASGNAADQKDCEALSVTVQPLIENVVVPEPDANGTTIAQPNPSTSAGTLGESGNPGDVFVEKQSDDCPYCHLLAQQEFLNGLEDFQAQLTGKMGDPEKLVFDPAKVKDCAPDYSQKPLAPDCYQAVFSAEAAAHYSDWLDFLNANHKQPFRSFAAKMKLAHCEVTLRFEADRKECPAYTYQDGTVVPVCMTYQIKDTRNRQFSHTFPVVYSKVTDYKPEEYFDHRTKGDVVEYSALRAKSWPGHTKSDLVRSMTDHTYEICRDAVK